MTFVGQLSVLFNNQIMKGNKLMNKDIITENLKPTEVFKYFADLCAIPRGSGNVKAVSDYCVEFAKKNGLSYRQDEMYNVIIKKPAAAGYENHPTVILQGHLDIVSVKEPGCTKDLLTEGLDLDIKDGYLYAKQTSLGADDGIAIAYAMAILADKNMKHPALEAIFTVDEEVGLLGATGLDCSDIEGRIMLNMDSEEEGTFIAGCAGGATVTCIFPVQRKEKRGLAADISLRGFTGGHSGVEIICQRANANVIAGRLLYNLKSKINYRLISVSGGEKDNAIAKFANIRILVEEDDVSKLEEFIEGFEKVIKSEYESTDSELEIKVEVGQKIVENVYKNSSAKAFLTALMNVPNGIQKMSNDIEGLVQTSLNLGIIKQNEESVELSFSVRSAIGTEKDNLMDKLRCLAEGLGGSCNIFGEYPQWEYQKDSPLRDTMVKIYKELYKSEPTIEIIHAGLECGVLADKLPGLDCISFGPAIEEIHTTREKLDIASVQRTWELVKEVLRQL